MTIDSTMTIAASQQHHATERVIQHHSTTHICIVSLSSLFSLYSPYRIHHGSSVHISQPDNSFMRSINRFHSIPVLTAYISLYLCSHLSVCSAQPLGVTLSQLLENKLIQSLIAALIGAMIGIFASFTVNCTLVEISINTFFAYVSRGQGQGMTAVGDVSKRKRIQRNSLTHIICSSVVFVSSVVLYSSSYCARIVSILVFFFFSSAASSVIACGRAIIRSRFCWLLSVRWCCYLVCYASCWRRIGSFI